MTAVPHSPPRQPPRPPTGDLAAKAFFYGRTPALLLDAAGTVVDVNAAARELFGLDVAGCKGQPAGYLVDRLRPRVAGPVLPPDGLAATRWLNAAAAAAGADWDRVLDTRDLRTAVASCRYQSERFGAVGLRVTEVPCVHTASGLCTGSAVGLEVEDLADPAGFRAALDRRLGHEVMWEVYAASYDRILPEMPFYQEVLQRHCAVLAPPSLETVLDVGAGTGLVTAWLLHAGKRVTAVDVSRAMLQRLYARVPGADADRLTVIEDTAERLPHLADASFDAVNVLLAFFDMDDPAAALAEALRLLRPGGMLAVTEPRACFDVAALMAAGEASLQERGVFGRLADDWRRIQTVAPLVRDAVKGSRRAAAVLPPGGWHAEAVLEILRRGGFTGLTFRESHLGNCATITGVKPGRPSP